MAYEKVPESAVRFDADLFTESGTANKSQKVHIKARKRGGINHPFWGPQTIHDLASFKLPERVAIDDSHGAEIGYGRPYLTPWGLEIDAVVCPMESDPTHPSNRILYNLKHGIPQQASIDFSGAFDVVQVEDGANPVVDSQVVEGEATILKNCTLRACAICESGADPSTSAVAQFSADKFAPSPRSVTRLEKKKESEPEAQKDASMSDQISGQPATDTKPTELSQPILPVETKPEVVDAKAETEDEKPTAETAVPAEAAAPAAAVEAIPVELAAAPETLTIESIRAEFTATTKSLTDEIASLKNRLAAATKPTVPAIPSVPSDVAQLSQPKSWTEAIKKAKELNPKFSGGQALQFAADKWPDLQQAAKNTAPRVVGMTPQTPQEK